MTRINIGKYTNTHGLKGEIKILSNFEYKDRLFVKGFKIYIKDQEYVISTYRHHQKYDMITLESINNIDDIESLKGNFIYIDRDDLHLKEDEYLYSDLINLEVIYNEKVLGIVKEIMYNNTNILLNIIGTKSIYIPLQDHFIKKIDFQNKLIIVDNVKGLI